MLLRQATFHQTKKASIWLAWKSQMSSTLNVPKKNGKTELTIGNFLCLARSLSIKHHTCVWWSFCVCLHLCVFYACTFACGARALAAAKLATSNPIHSTSAASSAFSTAALNSPMRNQVPKVWIFNLWRPPAVDMTYEITSLPLIIISVEPF